MKVRPLLAYRLLGTEVEVDQKKTYEATIATNIPDWKEKKLIFIGDEYGILLGEGEYEIVEGEFPESI